MTKIKLVNEKASYESSARWCSRTASREPEQELDMKKPRTILTLSGLVEPPASARAQQSPQRDAWRDAIATLADADLPLFERMRAEGRCLPMKIDIWREIASRTDRMSHAALKVQIEVLARSQPYIAACAAEGAMRHDLDGKAVEPVTAEHRQWATRRRSGRKK